MLFMVIEHFKDGDARPAYRRFADKGRLCPDGLTVVSSWVDAGFGRCFLLMECDDAALLAHRGYRHDGTEVSIGTGPDACTRCSADTSRTAATSHSTGTRR